MGKNKSFGLPYMGSKNRLAQDIIDFLPKREVLVDLFGGGGAISDCGRYYFNEVIYNEMDSLIYETFSNAINGVYKDEDRWISREEFHNLKNIDGYIALVWSFGNDRQTYLYGKTIEDFKKKAHFDDSIKTRLMHKERLKRINSIEYTDNITLLNKDYQDVVLPNSDKCVIYCDIPYKDTRNSYTSVFDYERFYKWCKGKANEGYDIYVSSYNLPNDKFDVVWQKPIKVYFSDRKVNDVTEKIYKPKTSV